MSDAPNTLPIVNRSGFPLQMHVQEVISRQSSKHGWHLFAHEHPWRHAEGHRGFIDLVAGSKGFWFSTVGERASRATMIIECKRIAGTWVFLAPPPLREGDGANLLFIQEGARTPAWSLRPFGPRMAESEYCVMETGGKDDRRQLEALGADLLESLEAIAQSDQEAFKDKANEYGSALYIPVLVTTAALQLCVFDQSAVSLKDGSVSFDGVKDQKSVPWVRFNKDLGFSGGVPRLEPVGRWGVRPPYQTVFVVSAERFGDFLERSAEGPVTLTR
ncbi:MAG: hypothetical protein ACHQ50_15655 [Fimbriimonadales bacterium]